MVISLVCPVRAIFAIISWPVLYLWFRLLNMICYRVLCVSVAVGVSNEASGDQDSVHRATNGSQDLPC